MGSGAQKRYPVDVLVLRGVRSPSGTRIFKLWKTGIRMAACTPTEGPPPPPTHPPPHRSASRRPGSREEDGVLIRRPPLAKATAARSTEKTAVEKWPQRTLPDPPPLVEAAGDTQRPWFCCDRDKTKVLGGRPR